MIRTDIIFSGYYGQKNTGDDAFVEVAAWGAKNLLNVNNVRFLAAQSSLPITLVKSNGYPLTIPKTYRFQQNILLNNCNCFISAGGSTFNKFITRDSIKGKSLAVKKKKGDRFKLGAIGISLGPFNSSDDERSVAEYLKHLDFLALRDKRSFDYALSLNLPYAPIESFDLAAILPDVYDFNKTHTQKEIQSKKVIGISLCNYESYIPNGDLNNENRRNLKLIELIKLLSSRSEEYHFKFFIINGHDKKGDLGITNSTIKSCGLKDNFSIVQYNKCTKQIWKDIAACDFVITTRLHAGIFACFAEVPFIMVEYHRKCVDFLKDVGYNDDYRVFDAEFDVNKVANTINEQIHYPHSYQYPKYTMDMKKLSYRNFDILNFLTNV